MNLAELRARGFDRAAHVPFTRSFRIACSQCAAVALNGGPTHESGCPNDTHECNGCNAIVPARVKYCEDCR